VVEVQIGGGEVEAFAFEEFEERVADGRIPPTARVRFEPVTGSDFAVAASLDLYTSLREGSAVAWQARFRNSGPPILTALLVGLQVRIWWWAQIQDVGEGMVSRGVNWLSPAFENGEPWRLLTYGLLHTDFLHVLLNMVWMGYTGWNIERALGRANLAAIFFFSVVAGGLLSMFLTPGVPSLGASGGVFGLVSASVVFGFARQDLLPPSGRRLFGVALAPYLVLMFLSGLSNAQTDNWAHFGGLAMGAVLALVLDPPGFERRAGRNRWIQGLGSAAIAVLLVVFGLFGPRLYPLVEREQARIDALPPASRVAAMERTGLLLTDLTFAVPAGWKTGTNAAGDLAFVSPGRGQERSYAVVQKERPRPTTVDEALGDWRASVTRGHADAEFEELPVEPWLDRPADQVRRVRVRLPADDRILEWIGTARGHYQLYRVTEVEAARAARLAPLFARADATLDWLEPLELQGARRNVLATPRGVEARRRLAVALAKWGEVDEALEILSTLVDERPTDPDRRVAYLEVAGWFPEVAPVVQLADETLAAQPVGEVVVAVADLLRTAGRPEAADGLLQLAWARTPGERVVKRALRMAGLRWVLTEAGVPTQVAFLPDGSLRPTDEVDAMLDAPLTVASAEVWAARFAEERRAILTGWEGWGTPERIAALLRVRDGGDEPVFDEPKLLSRQLRAVTRDGTFANWMVEPLPSLLDEATATTLLEALEPSGAAEDP
jgi:rhomboid protease GluP